MSNLYVMMKKPESSKYWTRSGSWGESFEAQIFEEAPDWNNAEAVQLEEHEARLLLTSDLTLKSTYVPQQVKPCAKWDLPLLKWEVALTKGSRTVYAGPYSMGIAHVEGVFPGTLDGSGFSLHTWTAVEDLYKQGRALYQSRPGQVSLTRCEARPPDLLGVLWSCLMDSSALDYPTFEDWARDFGYDEDSRKAEKIYQQCLNDAAVLGSTLGLRVHDLRIAFQNY